MFGTDKRKVFFVLKRNQANIPESFISYYLYEKRIMTHTSINIKEIGVGDKVQLQKISSQTFVKTFSESNTKEDMDRYLQENLNLEVLEAEIRNESSFFYFAISNNDIIGYLKLNSGSAQTELNDIQAIEIERIYILKDYHGQKIGQLLYEKAIEVAHKINAKYIWLGVWEKNFKAIRFYKKNGFMEFDKHIFKLGNDEQTDIMMKLIL